MKSLLPANAVPAPRAGLIQCAPLESVTRPTLTTEEAAFYLNRRPQTLRIWASTEEGPIRPLRLHGRLAWPVAEIRRLLGGAGGKR